MLFLRKRKSWNLLGGASLLLFALGVGLACLFGFPLVSGKYFLAPLASSLGMGLAIWALAQAHSQRNLGAAANAGLALNLLFLLVAGGLTLAGNGIEVASPPEEPPVSPQKSDGVKNARTEAPKNSEPVRVPEPAKPPEKPKEKPPTLPELLAALKDSAAEKRQAAATALGKIGAKGRIAYFPLVQALQDSSKPVREAARAALRSLGQPSFVDLDDFRGALNDPQRSVRVAAAQAFRLFGPAAKEALPDLKKSLNDPDLGVRLWAAQALALWSCPPGELLPVFQQALGHYQDLETGPCTFAALALGAMGREAKQALPELCRALQHPDAGVRKAAVLALVQIAVPSKEVVAALSRLLRDPEESVCTQACCALGAFGPKAREAIPALCSIQRPEAEVNLAITRALRAIALPSPTAVTFLQTTLQESRHGELTKEVLLTLALFGEKAKKAAQVVRMICRDPQRDLQIRTTAAYVLIRFGLVDTPIISTLRLALKGEDAGLGPWAALTLGACGPKAKEAVPDLLAILQSQQAEPSLRVQAATALGYIGDKAVIPCFRRLLRPSRNGQRALLPDSERPVREAIALALKFLEAGIGNRQ